MLTTSCRGWKGTGGLCASALSEDHQRCDPPGRGKRHSQERRVWKEDRWNQDSRGGTTGWRKKKDVFSGSDRGIQEELGDLCGGLHS